MDTGLSEFLRTADPLEEFEQARFGDKRLTRRCVALARALARSPSSSLPRVAASDSEVAGAYRFLNNERVDPESLLRPHQLATVKRASILPECLVIHDTTTLRFEGARNGLGRLTGSGRGFLAHVSLVASADGRGLPIGVIGSEFVTRSEEKQSRRPKYSFGPDSEHSRWERGVEAAELKLRKATSCIHLMDREGDSYLLLSRMVAEARRFVIRLAQNRAIEDLGGQGHGRLVEAVADLPVLAERDARLTARTAKGRAPRALLRHPPRAERTAHLVVTATVVRLKRPHAAPRHLPETLEVNVVRVHEPNPPSGAAPVEWLLVTSELCDTEQQVLRVVDFYRKRWLIEDLFKALKTGCAVQQREFVEAAALKNIFALSVPLAWQMLLLRALAREEPAVSADAVLSPSQLQILRPACRKLPPRQRPPAKPNVRQALIAIAALGGHLTRNGEPGWLTLARGLEFLLNLELGYDIGRGANRTPQDV
jgi:hypothetical protein